MANDLLNKVSLENPLVRVDAKGSATLFICINNKTISNFVNDKSIKCANYFALMSTERVNRERLLGVGNTLSHL